MNDIDYTLRTILFILAGSFLAACNPDMPKEVEVAMNALPDQIDFNFHVRPILSDKCWSCHGPDAEARKASLRLDTKEGAFSRNTTSAARAVVKGHPEKSALVTRILSLEQETVMPPPESNLTLEAEEKAILIRWIEQGAEWKPHWAFIPPHKPELPDVKNAEWSHNPIDRFILNRLEREELDPSPPASPERLLRRVFFDLTGLPPTIRQIDAFLQDPSLSAYEKIVDSLLQTDAHAERLAMEWMDIARYADSHGYHADGLRRMWPWRDWVIRAFRENMPYDQFVTWQLAGDLLPNATQEQKLATAFHRNHPQNSEAGSVDEEFRVQYVIDRVNTTATAFMGLTVECAQCHDHKFDPISQKEYFQMAAFFNNIRQLGISGNEGNYGPLLLLTDSTQRARLDSLDRQIQAQESSLQLTRQEIEATEKWLSQLPPPDLSKGLLGYFPGERLTPGPKKNASYLDGHPKTRVTSGVQLREGIQGKALEFDDEYDEVYLEKIGLFEWTEPYSAAAWIRPVIHRPGKTQTILGTAGNKNNFWRGWDFYLDSLNHLSVRLIHALPGDYIHVSSADSLRLNEWTHVAFTYDGSGKAAGLQLFINGEACTQNTLFDHLSKSIKTVKGNSHVLENRPIRAGKSYRNFSGDNGIFSGLMDEIRLYQRDLSSLEVSTLAGHTHPEDNWNSFRATLEDTANIKLKDYAFHQNPQLQKARQQLRSLLQEKLSLINPIPEIMVMEDMSPPRSTYILHRGQYDQPRERVYPNTPAKILPLPKHLPRNRLGLARWLFLEDHPLTARVTVNRYWQLFFGRGMVDTPQDFGSQGSLPSHPALLDWLAVDFREKGWDLRRLCKMIVMSATYRQSSALSLELARRDPGNRLLTRGPHHRLPAEMIRDNALAASGLLVRTVGGESVKPHQPDSLWIEKGNFSYNLMHYVPDQGDSLYRRSMYTFIRRTSPPPFMVNFNAPNRAICVVERERTNTPLQALNLLNDPQFLEAARVLAERIQRKDKAERKSPISQAFRLVTSRRPTEKELDILTRQYERELTRFQGDPDAARKLLAIGAYPTDPTLDPAKTAALAVVANTLLNSDAAYMKR